jgi:hypothetical protein
VTYNGTGAFMSTGEKYYDKKCGKIDIKKGANYSYSYEGPDIEDKELRKTVSKNIEKNITQCMEKYDSYDVLISNKEEINNCIISSNTINNVKINTMNIIIELTDKGNEQYTKCDNTTISNDEISKKETQTTTEELKEEQVLPTPKQNNNSILGSNLFILIGIIAVLVIVFFLIISRKKKITNVDENNINQETNDSQPEQTLSKNDPIEVLDEEPQQQDNKEKTSTNDDIEII